ncbi:MAG: cytochrome c oxidase subunit II [Chloroflexaceae bacterium]|nr:cytochrome c oxidase subunit II [Chloroflexaceae bacterium]
MTIPSNILTLLAGVAITLVSLWYGQNHGLLPVAASSEATQVDNLFNLMMTIATALFLLIQGVLIFSAFKFRRQAGDLTDGPAFEDNIPLEIVWTAIPAVIVFILAVYSFEIYNAMGGLDPVNSRDPGPTVTAIAEPNTLVAFNPDGELALGIGVSPEDPAQQALAPLEVNVQGLQYAWIFTYPDTGIVTGDMHIPANRPVELNISAADVLHAFWLPEFRLKQDAIPGRVTKLVFTATRLGEYPIVCAELCGAYHGAMKSQLYVQTLEDYQQWQQENSPEQAENTEEIALNPAELSPGQFLAPYAAEAGISAKTLEAIP